MPSHPDRVRRNYERTDYFRASPPAVNWCSIGVGAGDTGLFVHGPYDAIKRVQDMIFELENLRARLAHATR